MSHRNKGWPSSRQQETQESVLRQKIIFQDHEAASNSKENVLLYQDNHEKKQSR